MYYSVKIFLFCLFIRYISDLEVRSGPVQTSYTHHWLPVSSYIGPSDDDDDDWAQVIHEWPGLYIHESHIAHDWPEHNMHIHICTTTCILEEQSRTPYPT